MSGHCFGCGGPLGGARCPLCDPRPISVDREAGCFCAGHEVPIREWRPVLGCPVHAPSDLGRGMTIDLAVLDEIRDWNTADVRPDL